jgi:hypothetical protein
LLVLALAAGSAGIAAAADVPRIAITSGTPQTVRVWVAPRANRYEAKYEQALTVSVSPPTLKVRFRCITRGCEFPAQDEPENVARVGPSAYDVTGVKGKASIKLVIWTVTPQNVVVTAQPSSGSAQPQVRFVLGEF